MKRERIVIVGAGGHAREVMEILLSCQRAGVDVEPIGFVHDGSNVPETLNGVPVLGNLEWLDGIDRADLGVICAVGTPSVCFMLAERVRASGFRVAHAIAPTAWIATSAKVGEGVMIFPNVVVNANAVIGDHVSLNVGSSVSHDSSVGPFCSVGPGARLAGNVILGARCFVGMGANVVHGVSIGDGCVIGAGSVVLQDLPAAVTAVGVPARVTGPASESPMARTRSQDEARVEP
jgi:UDP-perosamine 4-acetyltransferase